MSEKGKKIQKISIFAALVMLIVMVWGVSVMADTSAVVIGDDCSAYGDLTDDGIIQEDDAIYLLYHSVFGEETYPLNNFQKDGDITALDAIGLLTLEGQKAVHAYKDPIWQWDEEAGTAKAVFHCACGDGKVLVKDATVTAEETKATCISQGIVEYKAEVTLVDNHVYTEEKTVQTSPATGTHTYDTNLVCSDRTCTVCEHVEAASAHVFEVVQTTTATCTDAATITYRCSSCNGEEYTVEDGLAAGHSYGAAVETLVSGCEYKEVYTCSECTQSVDGEHYHKHEEVASIKEEATCSHEGTKVYTCKTCKTEIKTESIEIVADAHTWDDGEEDGALIVYTCEEIGCAKTRTAINAVAQDKVEVTSQTLKDTNEIDLNGTSIKLDKETAAQLTGDVEIKAEEKNASELELTVDLTEEQKKQIGDNPVYDFSITDANGAVGKEDGSIAITISLPYELKDGDDVDCIDVWFIADDGTVKAQKGTYANGQVTFTATHFSYYTVTRLTPAERCEQYGHNDTTNTVKATCTTGGYTLHVCARCNKTWKTDEVPALGHSTTTTTTEATCTTAGKTVVTCANCDYKSTATTPATGHKWEETKEEATCEGTKTVTVGCENCDAQKEIVLPQLKHDLTITSVPATCEDKAYDHTTCKNCEYELKTYTAPAKGHVYKVTEWTWGYDEDAEKVTAEAAFVCTTDGCEKSFVKEATVTLEKELGVTCEKDGYKTYLAKIVYNSKAYTAEKTDEFKATGHNLSKNLEYNASKHYQVCTICKKELNVEEHILDSLISKPATCTEEGEKLLTCTKCDYERTESIPAKGHNIVDDVCIDCGYTTNVCKHDNFHSVEIELKVEDGFCGGVLYYSTCDCEKVSYFEGYSLECDAEYEEIRDTDKNGYVVYDITAKCNDCGLHLKEVDRWEINEAECKGTLYSDITVCNKKDEKVFEFSGINFEDMEHPNAVYGTPDDLKKYGMCGGTVTNVSCPCGRDEMLVLDFDCDFVDVPDKCGEGLYVAECTTCGTELVNTYGEEKIGQCKVLYAEEYAFWKAGKELVAYEYSFEMENHDSEISFDLEGETCSDGYTVHEKCKVCGYEDTHFEQMPPEMHREFQKFIDVSKYNLCVDQISVWTCPCDKVFRVSNIYGEHHFVNVDYEQIELEDGYQINVTEKCTDCELTKESVQKYTFTGNGCECVYEYISDYSVKGEVIFTEKESRLDESHNFEIIDEKLMGDTCEDGVIFTLQCTECDEIATNRIYYHEHYVKESYDAAKYGMCEGKIEVVGCACDKYNDINENIACDWAFVNYDEKTNTDTYRCTKCNIINNCIYTETGSNGCFVNGTVVYEYVKDATVVLSVETTYAREEHDFTYTFEIEEGKKCEDGFIINMECQDCGMTNSWFEQTEPGEHRNYLTKSYNMKDYGFCNGELNVYECPCGESSGTNWYDIGCQWQWVESGNNNEYSVVKCAICGATRHVYEKAGETIGCYTRYEVTNVLFDAAGKELLTVTTHENYGNHDFDITFEIADGASCADGYTVIRTCKICDEVYTDFNQMPEGEHMTYCVDTYDMKEYGFCGGEVEVRVCPCGEEKSIDWNIERYCDLRWTNDDISGTSTAKCNTCNSKYSIRSGRQEIDECHENIYTLYEFYKPNGEEAFNLDYAYVNETHDDTYTFEVNGPSCEAGYTVTKECTVCGDVRQERGFEHIAYRVETKDLKEFGFCGGSVDYYRCACGQEERVWSEQSCNWSTVGYDEKTNTWIYECTECGSGLSESYVESNKDANCMVYYTEYYSLFKADGALVEEYSTTHERVEHDMVYDFELQGTSCEDGYYVVRTCEDCSFYEKDEELYRNHSNWQIERISFADLGMCGGYATHYRCACGESESWDSWTECCWSWTDMNTVVCDNCGVTRVMDTVKEEIDACHSKYTWTYTYSMKDEVILSYSEVGIGEEHDAVYTLTLVNPYGDCNDGYIAYGICDVCHEEIRNENRGHDRYAVEKADLSDDGLCSGTTVVRYACACGEENEVTDYAYEGSCHWQYIGVTDFAYDWDYDVVSAEAYRCVDSVSAGTYSCGAIRKRAYAVIGKGENCEEMVEILTVYYNKDKEAVYAYTENATRTNHNYVEKSFDMIDINNCEAGFYRVVECKDCGDAERYYYDWHMFTGEKYYDLAEYGACPGSYVVLNSCPCGKAQYHDFGSPYCNIDQTFNQYVENGVEHEVIVNRCENCDLCYKQDRVFEYDYENCNEVRHSTITISIGNTFVAGPFKQTDSYPKHDYVEHVTLVDGATNCEEGVIVLQECKNCDYKWENTYNWHYGIVLESYDLTEYGSVCGGKLVRTACACGENNGAGLSDQECDMYHRNVLSEEEYTNQYTTQGYNSYWRYEAIYKCAVTDPQCGFAVYETNYHVWDEENCEMISYTSWKLGYDDQTGSYVKEVVFETDRNAYHAYDVTRSEDGNSETGVCKHCGSSYVIKYTYGENGYLVYSEESAINTLDNCENKSYSRIEERVEKTNDSYQWKNYHDITYADGTTWWSHYDYEYDWDNFDCTAICTYTNSEGAYDVSTVSCHSGWNEWKYETLGCSQMGRQYLVCHCGVCGQDVILEEYPMMPGHSWYWDDMKGIYACGICGIENKNGSDGSIVLEDMSAEFGNGTDYVIGYYQYDNVRFSYELLVVLGEHEIPLDGIAFSELTADKDGITAIKFNKAEAEAAAIAALNAEGVTNTDGFALRFVFIPDSSDGDLDYAITLTDESIAK